MKSINIANFDATNTVVNKFKVSGFDVIITDSKGEVLRISDGLPELLLGNIQLKNTEGHTIDVSEIIESIDASKLGLDVAVLGGLIDGADVQSDQKGSKSAEKSDDEDKLAELLSENKKLKEQLSEAQQQKESEEIVQILAEKSEITPQQYPEQPLVQSAAQPLSVSKKKPIILDDGGGSSASNIQSNDSSGLKDDAADASFVLPLSITLSEGSDSGVIGDNVTNHANPVFTGMTAPSAEVVLTIGGKSYTTTADADGRWSITVSEPLPEGSNPYTVEATSPNGAAGSLQGGVVIDTQAQEITVKLDSASDTGVKGDFTTQIATPTLNGTAEAGATVTLQIGSHSYTFTADASGRWSFTLPESLNEGTHDYTITATDKAGNSTSVEGSVTIDMTGPQLTQQIDPSNDILLGNVIGNERPTFSGQTEPGIRITISIAGRTYDVIADENGEWSFTVPVALGNNSWDYEITATDAAGNQTILKDQVVIQHQPSVVNIPVSGELDASTDSGDLGDKITNSKTPMFSGKTVPGATVTLFIGGKEYTGLADKDGNWTISVTDDLPDGVHDYQIKASDSSGSTGTFNGYVTVDTEAPNIEAGLSSGSDSGIKGDGTTNVKLPILTGNTEPYATVKITIGGIDYETVADSSGQWSVQITDPLMEGINNYDITVTDAAGNNSSATGSLTVDTTAPSLSGIKFDDGFDDRFSSTYTPTIKGWGEAGSTIDIIIGSRKYSVIVPDNRQWQFKVPPGFITIGNKVQYIKFIETDAAGNKTEQTIKFQFITDKSNITADISATTDTDIVGDKVTSNTKPVLTGTVSSNGQTAAQIAKAKISISINGKIYENIPVNKDGTWSFPLPDELATGNTYNYTVTVTDFVGNKNTYESYVTISTLSGALDAQSITGQGSNVETSDVTPTLSGSANAGSTLTILINNKTYTVVATANGTWSLNIADTLADGKYEYKITEKTTDGKTNTFDGYFVVDTKAPTILTAALEEPASGNASISNRPDLTLKGKTEAFALVTIVIAGITYQTKADENGNWSYTFDKAAFDINKPYSYQVTASDAAGNQTSINGSFTVDTITIDANLDINSNSGDTNDNITNVVTPVISGKTVADATITLEIGGKVYTTTADSNGNWSIQVDTLTDNIYSYTVTAEKDGKINYASGNIVIDTSAITPTVELDGNSDTGVTGDNMTNNPTPILTGLAEAGATVTVTVNGESYTAVAGLDGSWSLEITHSLNEGVNDYTVQVTDKAGNQSDPVTGQITLDTKAPELTDIKLSCADDADHDNKTEQTNPTFTGKVDDTEATVTISFDDSDEKYPVTVNSDGTWSYQHSSDFILGEHKFTVEVTDKAGNTSSSSHDFEVVDSSTIPAPFVEEAAPIELEGGTQAGARVDLSIGDDVYSTQADNSGKWNITTKPYSQGTYGYEIKVTTLTGEIVSDKGEIDAVQESVEMTQSTSHSTDSEFAVLLANSFGDQNNFTSSEDHL